MKILSKDTLLQGIKQTKTVELKSIQGAVKLRPLSQTEVAEYRRITAKAMGKFETSEKARRGLRKGTDVSTNGVIDLEKSSKAHSEAERYAVAKAMSCDGEDWTEEEVGELTRAVFNEIFEEVQDMSGLEDEEMVEAVEEFRED